MSYDSKNRPTSHTDSGGPNRTLAYDARGNVTSLGALNFTYDLSDQPVAISGSASGTYRYDGNFKRVKSVVNPGSGSGTGGKTIYNVYDAGGTLVHIDNVTDGKKTDYIKAGSLTIARVENNVPTYLHNDHLGSAQTGTNAAGNGHCRGLLRLHLIHWIKCFGDAEPPTKWREKYTPYGSSMNNPAANDNQAGFTGHIKDSTTGLTYMQARYYDPLIGRFLSIDPVGFLPSQPFMFGRYTYVGNDPMNLIDPDGESPVSWAVKLVKGGLKKTKTFLDKKHAIRARQRGENVKASTRQMAGEIEYAAANDPGKVIRHSGHKLTDGSGKTGAPHFQTKGKSGHTFYSTASATLGGIITALEVIEQFDPFHIGSVACPDYECNREKWDQENPNGFSDWNGEADTSGSTGQSSQQNSDDNNSDWSIDGEYITGTRCNGRLDCEE
jgi:RHS repeat-associated protein